MHAPPSLPARYLAPAFVAEGAFGRVWRAELAGEPVAVKVLAPAHLGRPELVWRFGAEFRRLAALAHPAFPRAIEQGLTADGCPFYAMSFLPGTPPVAPIAAAHARQVLTGLAEALAALHARGLVHGDLKPANVLVAPDGTVRLLDVGEARPIGSRDEAAGGTLAYMAPELLRRAPADPAADWYALATLGHWLLAGRTPFTADAGGPAALVRAQLFEPPPATPASGDARLAAAIDALLVKDPQRRRQALPALFAALALPAPPPPAPALDLGAWLPRAEASEAWRQLEGGSDVVLTGAPGAGKSRTLEALRLEARLAGRPWLAGAGGEAGAAPGALARALVRQALATSGRPATPAVAAWLDGHMPEAWLDLEPRARKLALFGELDAAWAGLADALVGIDDWQQADASSRELVVRWREQGRARFCLASEAEEPGAIALGPWRADEVAALLALRLGEAPPAALGEAIAAAAPRLPGELDALLAHWAATGALRHDGAGWRFAPADGGDAGDPWARLWAARLAGLGPDARALARLAAAAREGGALSAGWLGRVLGLDDGALQAAVDALVAAGTLLGSAEGVRLAPMPEAERLAAELPPAARAAMLAELARLRLGPALDEAGLAAAPLADLVAAAALAAGGDDDELAVALAGAAAQRALEHLALDDARRILARARARLTEAIPAGRRQALFFVGAEAARLGDRSEEAAADYEHALALAEMLGDAQAVARAALGLAKCRQLRGDYATAQALVERAEAEAERAGQRALAARAAVVRARIELFRGEGAAARASCARAVALATEAGAPAVRSAALNLQGVLLAADDPTRGAEALAMIREAVALAERVGDTVGVAAALENLGNAHLSLGELAEAREAFARDAALCREHGIATEGLSADMNLALVLAELGQAAEARALADDVLARARALGRAFIETITLAVRGQAAWRGGNAAAARADLDAALARATAIANRLAEEHVRLTRLEAWIALGELVAAREEAARVAELVAASGHAEGALKLAALQAALALAEGDPASAAELAGPLVGSPNRQIAYTALTVRGRALEALGHATEAREALAEAAAIARGWGVSPAAEPAGAATAIDVAALTPWLAALLAAADERAVHERLLAAVAALARAERGYLLSYERGRLLEAVTLGVDYEAEVAQGFSSSICEQVLWTGEPVYLVDASAEGQWKDAASVVSLGLRTVLALPWGTPRTLLGVVYVDRQALDPLLGEADLGALRLVAELAADRVLAMRREREGVEALAFQRRLTDLVIGLAGAAAGDRRGLVLEAARALTGAARAHWLVRDGDGLRALASAGAETFDPARISRSILARVAETGEAECLVETDRPEGWTPGQSVLALGIRMLWCVPAGPDEVVYLDSDRLDLPDPHGVATRVQELIARVGELVRG